jgi:radical SAM-linked protein
VLIVNTPVHRLRITYGKTDDCRFISHLDLGACLHRALKRADLPLAYTEGFSPRPRTSFGPPLPLFVEGDQEMADIELTAAIPAEDVVPVLNGFLPVGIRLRSATYVANQTPSITAMVRRARYRVSKRDGGMWTELTPERVANFLQPTSIVIEKESKGTKKQIDIRSGILSLAVVDGALEVELESGPSRSINIFDLLGALEPGLTAAQSAGYRVMRLGFSFEEILRPDVGAAN